MKLIGFQIKMYKCVLDSGHVSVAPLTVLVGKNESGKTTLLKALHKFNPFKTEPYSIPVEWPRAYRDKRSKDQVVCTAEFMLSPDEQQGLVDLTGSRLRVDTLQIEKDYEGKFEIQFPADTFSDQLHPNDIDQACAALPSVAEPANAEFIANTNQCKDEAKRLAHEGRFSELATAGARHTQTLQSVRSPASQNPQHQNEQTFITQYTQALNNISQKLVNAPTIHQKAHDYVISRLPVFVYMDEYRTFRGTALLDQVKQRQDRNQLTEDDKTFLTILALSGLNLDEEVKKAGQSGREERQYDLSDAAATLTRAIADHWGQSRYEVEFRADSNEFFTFVKDRRDKTLIKLEERSKGFQWFFSFDLMLMHETKGTLKDCVILLDEPGLHLHPQAQTDLIGRLEEYAGGNTLIYSSHSPFMLDLQEPDRIRVINETDHGTVVTEDLAQSQPEAKLTLQAALGISGRTSFLVSEKNLVVEGVDDYLYLTALSNLFVRSGQAGLNDEIRITPAGGASEATYIATFMIGQSLRVAVLYDTDSAGNTAKDKLVKSWLTRYQDARALALSLGPAVDVSDRNFGIEDLFPEDYYLSYVEAYYKAQLGAAQIETIKLPNGGMLCKRIERFFEENGLPPFNKGAVAKRIRNTIKEMKSVDNLPSNTKNKVTTLFKKINEFFSDEHA
jgi:predicted ATP-dependent endonuclease of OLD family